jgi:dinuclear metal center YbgI/SA1388 family protein
MKLATIISSLEQLAPSAFQESYDNASLLVGHPDMDITGVLCTLDTLEDVVDEAIKRKCNLIVSHHPIIFKGLKSITGKNYVERTVIKAIKNNIAIYAIHTNLDNVRYGVNNKIALKLELTNLKILAPKGNLLSKLVTYVPYKQSINLRQSLFEAGAGKISNYDMCSFNIDGIGTFRPNESAKPFIGNRGEITEQAEIRIEVLFENHLQANILKALRKAHPYEEIAYDILPISNEHNWVGSGMIGYLKKPMQQAEFLQFLKEKMNTDCIRYTGNYTKAIEKIALCGGSGSFLLQHAIRTKADCYISADFKYHEFFDAENNILIADIGHYESEQFTIELLVDYLQKNFPTFAIHFSEINTNPIKYYF